MRPPSPSLLVSCLIALLLANSALAQTTPSILIPSSTSPTTSTTTPDTQTTSPTTSPTTRTNPTTTQTTLTTTTGPSTTPTNIQSTSPPSSSLQESLTTVLSTSTNQNGDAVTVTVTSLSSSSTPSSTNTAVSENDNDGGGRLGIGPIIGMSVAGGIAVIGIVAFVIWKLTRKRFSDFDDNEAIKWPELNSHGNNDSHPLPVHNTGRAGFETGSEASLSRVNSSNYSTPDFASGAHTDPYAVPPLPHLNPNQPYRDDPNSVSGYYDPYRGPVPGTLENGGSDWHGEAIPMTQMNAGGRTMSPAPSANYGFDTGRQSPAPQLAYGGRASPGPQAAYGGRISPGPHVAYGTQGGYDGYGPR